MWSLEASTPACQTSTCGTATAMREPTPDPGQWLRTRQAPDGGRSWGGNPTQQPRLVLGDDEGCFAAALDAMRRHGGVLEPPEASPAAFGFLTPPRAGGWS